MFWAVFESLCEGEGRKPNPVAKELGIPSGSLTKWKNGALPSTENLIKISSHFGVTIDYLLTGNSMLVELDPIDQAWLDLIHNLPEDAQNDFRGAMRLYIELHGAAETARKDELRDAK